MVIIDNKKDYYDYLQGIIGMDEKVVYDRRGSTIVGASEVYLFDYAHDYDLYFSSKPFKEDTPKKRIPYWESKYYDNITRNGIKFSKKIKHLTEGNIYYLFLEVGYHQFIFQIERYIEDGELKVDVGIVSHITVNKNGKKSKAPMFITTMRYYYGGLEYSNSGVENPILCNTWIPSKISPEAMWNMLYEYISSLNDKEFTDSRTNEQHIESAGFDKKISFRHRK